MDRTERIIATRTYDSPCGQLTLGSADGLLCLCDWPAEPRHSRVKGRLARLLDATFEQHPTATTDEAARQLDAYFDGQLAVFDIGLLPIGTAFQQSVWAALGRIRFGSTATYASIARNIGRPEAVRAVANAVGANALSLFVPCHRVVGSDGRLTGYAGGLPAKRMLLALERQAKNKFPME